MPVVEAADFLRFIPRVNESLEDTIPMGEKEGKYHCNLWLWASQGCRAYWRNTQAIQWIVSALNGGQREVLSPDVQDFVEAKGWELSSKSAVSSTGKGQEWGHKGHKALEEL